MDGGDAVFGVVIVLVGDAILHAAGHTCTPGKTPGQLCTERTKSPKRSGVGAQVQVYSRSRRRPAPSVVEGCRRLVTQNHRPRTTRRGDERGRRRRSAAASLPGPTV
jgi:hypothetical protein